MSSEMKNEVTVNSLLMKSLESATREYARKCVSELACEYGFSEEEALKKLNLEKLKLQVQEMKKRSGGKAKAKEAKAKAEKAEKREKKVKALYAMPFSKENVLETGCQGLAYNGGLFTQCARECMESLKYCKVCQSEIDKNGGTTNGTIEQRLSCGLMEFKDPRGRKPVAYVKIMEKQNVTREQVEAEAGKQNILIDEIHFVAEEKKGKAKGKKETVTVSKEDDLIAQLMDSVEDSSEEEVVLQEEQADEKALKAQQDEEKAHKKQQQDEEKALKAQQKQQQDEEKALKAQQKQQQADEKALKAQQKQQQADEKAAKAQQIADEKAAKAKQQADEKAAKAQQIADEKAAKVKQQADEKAAKAKQQADEKAEKEKKIADEKAALRSAKEQQIADEKAAKAKQIADEKALVKQQKEAEVALKKQQEKEEGIQKLKEHQKKATTPDPKEKKQKEGTKAIVATKANFKVGDKVKHNQLGVETIAIVTEVKMGKSFVEYKLRAVDDEREFAAPEGNLMTFKEPETSAPKKVTVKRITIDGKQYLKTGENLLYDPETKEEMGIYDPVTNTIKDLPDDSEDELSEDEVSDDE